MQFSLSEEEYLIQDTARKLAEDRSLRWPRNWTRAAAGKPFSPI